MAALPKKKSSKRRTGTRRTSWFKTTKIVNFQKCPKCGKEKLPHTACPHCGFYKEYEASRVHTRGIFSSLGNAESAEAEGKPFVQGFAAVVFCEGG